MLKKLRRGFLWARALRRLGVRNTVDALADIRTMESMAPLRPYENALKAGLLLCAEDYDEAEELYAEVIAKTADSDNANDQYVALYANFMLAEMRDDAAAAEAFRARAEGVACRRILRRWLPM